MPPVGFEPTISAGEKPQTYALDGAATGTGNARRSVDWIFFLIKEKNNRNNAAWLYKNKDI